MARTRAWTEVEDYFLKGHAAKMSPEELGEKLSRKAKEVVKRMGELAIDIDKAESQRRTAGFVTHPTGAVAMTGARSKADDDASRRAPDPDQKKDNEAFLKARAGGIHKIW